MFKKKEILDNINIYLSTLSYYIENENKNGLVDSNSLSEDFYCRLFNKVYGYELSNLNALKMNFPAIDLGDEENKICYQITSTSKPAKIKSTLQKFTDKELYKKYDCLYIFIINSKKPRKAQYNCKLFHFNHANILNIPDLYGDISKKSIKEMREILSILEEELKFLKESSSIKYLDSVNKITFKYGNNYNSFIVDSYGYNLANPDDKCCFEDAKKELDTFLDVMRYLHYNTREVIVAILKNRIKKEHNYKILFNRYEVRKYMNLDEVTYSNELRILLDKNLIDVTENTGEENDILFYYGGTDDLFYDIVKYCKKYSISRKELFLSLDFTLLD